MPDTGAPWNIPYVESTDLVSDWPTDSLALANAIDAGLSAGYKLAGTRYYTSSGTFDKADPLGTGDIGLRAIRVTVVGGGGGGSSSSSNGEGGGGGGGGAQSFITDIAGLASSVTVTRGSGGAADNPGGASSFGTAVAANGGDGTGSIGGNAGGSGTAGDLQVSGSAGTNGLRSLTDGGRYFSGAGGNSAFGIGGGGRPLVGTSNTPGVAGGLYGGGGGGAIGTDTGGAGASGIVIIDCYV